MKKILTLVATSAILMSLFTGCGSQTKTTTTQSSTSTTTQSSSSSSATTDSQNKKMPDLAGEVTAINGSQVTLKLIELPTVNSDKNGTTQNGQSSSSNSSSQNSQQSGQKPDGNPPSDQSGQKPKMEVKYTGETKSITIADGVSITSHTMDQNGGTEKTLAVKDIKVGDRLDISYSDSNKTTISKISVRGSSQAQTQTQTQSQN